MVKTGCFFRANTPIAKPAIINDISPLFMGVPPQKEAFCGRAPTHLQQLVCWPGGDCEQTVLLLKVPQFCAFAEKMASCSKSINKNAFFISIRG